MNKLLVKTVLSALLFNMIGTVNAQEWKSSQGIDSQFAVNSIQQNGTSLIAFGQKMWMEGSSFKSKPVSYISDDNGMVWQPFKEIQNGNSTANSLCLSGERMITSGRKGEAQVDWIGAVCYSDNGKDWTEATGVPSDVAIGKIFNNGDRLIAVGQRQWREGMSFLSEPKSYVSSDNGATWETFILMPHELSTTGAFAENDGRYITSGRLGQAQMDWVGAAFYTDDNGKTWIKATGIPENVSLTQIEAIDGKLIAAGQKQWRDGMSFMSEPKMYVSEDNGATWTDFITVNNGLSTIGAFYIKDNVLVMGGRKGEAQMEWVGEMDYTKL